MHICYSSSAMYLGILLYEKITLILLKLAKYIKKRVLRQCQHEIKCLKSKIYLQTAEYAAIRYLTGRMALQLSRNEDLWYI